MPFAPAALDAVMSAADRALEAVRARTAGAAAAAIDRWRSDANAVRFHLREADRAGADRPLLLAIVGGTGTGKSTLVNRLLKAQITATSFRRTFTAGAIAIAAEPRNLPAGWLAIEHRVAGTADLPARGTPDSLIVITDSSSELTRRVTIVDTPDLDGDQPLHHVQADRAFRWAQAILFLVTPEKYQMTELLPYYRLARRYAIPTLFVMNKAEEQAVVDDFAAQLAGRGWEGARVFAIPRDDAAYEPPPDQNLDALREAVTTLRPPETAVWREGLRARAGDLLGRLQDQILAPLRSERQQADQLAASVKALATPELGVDVNPLTTQLQRRLQHKSVLYLMGPQRMLERVRQVPGMVLRMPRTLWDVVVRGKGAKLSEPKQPDPPADQQVPNFKAAVTDQFTVVQSRIEDVLRSSPAGQKWITANESSYRAARLDPADAGKIADEELKELEQWLTERWNATPRDTLLIMKLIRHLPGGQKLTKYTEGAPYLLAVIVATHGAIMGPVDLLVMGGWSLGAWATEKLSNEVTARARAANRRIGERFTDLAHRQVEQVVAWLDQQAPTMREIREVEGVAEQLSGLVSPAE